MNACRNLLDNAKPLPHQNCDETSHDSMPTSAEMIEDPLSVHSKNIKNLGTQCRRLNPSPHQYTMIHSELYETVVSKLWIVVHASYNINLGYTGK